MFAGDGGFATHKLSRFAARHSQQLTLVSKIVPDAVLHAPPPERKPGQQGRPRTVGARLPSPLKNSQNPTKFRFVYFSLLSSSQGY
ncbi:MAG: hypothetical protein CMN21_15040 [Rubinisphaera sp.]|nr:hypothetical protein [Rubinisphaera sp.]